MNGPTLIVIGPLPPPVHGVTVSTALVLANPELARSFRVRHLDTSDPRSRANVGRWDVVNVLLGLRALLQLARLLTGPRGVVYLPLSQAAPAFLRDSLFIRLAALRRWKVVAHLRGSEFREVYAARGPLFRRWARSTLARLDSVAVMGESLRRVFDGLVPGERIAVVPNGTPDPRPNGLSRDGRTVLFLSNLRRRKGVVESLDAALQVLADHPEARFVFAGSWEDEGLERELRERAAPAGERVRFVPEVRDEAKRELLLSSSVLLFPPVRPEGHPRVVLEALAAGVPPVTTNRGAIAETVVDGESGFVVAEPVPETLAARVLELLRDDALRERMSRAARDRYLERFTQEEADRRLVEWLEAVARG